MRTVCAWIVALTLATTAAAACADAGPAAGTAAGEAEQPPIYTEAVVVTASKVEQQLVNAPATVSVVSSDVIAELAGHQLRRAAALGARHEHHADLGA